MPYKLQIFKQKFIDSEGKQTSYFQEDPYSESKAYQALSFKVDRETYFFREGKTTGTRPGQFITFWKRPQKEIEPFDKSDEIDFLVIASKDPLGKELGFFVFPKLILLKKKILSDISLQKKGKLAFRVFPPWSESFIPNGAEKTQKMSISAKKTQEWQLKYFQGA